MSVFRGVRSARTTFGSKLNAVSDRIEQGRLSKLCKSRLITVLIFFK